jgi:uncharacterized membrane protein
MKEVESDTAFAVIGIVCVIIGFVFAVLTGLANTNIEVFEFLSWTKSYLIGAMIAICFIVIGAILLVASRR